MPGADGIVAERDAVDAPGHALAADGDGERVMGPALLAQGDAGMALGKGHEAQLRSSH
jgi:hypothetical protein